MEVHVLHDPPAPIRQLHEDLEAFELKISTDVKSS